MVPMGRDPRIDEYAADDGSGWILLVLLVIGFVIWRIGQSTMWANLQQARLERRRRRIADYLDDDEDDPYGEHHLALRAHWHQIVAEHGATCSERICLRPSRTIARGAYFHLAHDHDSGGPRDYLGPAHPECNEHEARVRGVVWEDELESDDFRVADAPVAEPYDPWSAPSGENETDDPSTRT